MNYVQLLEPLIKIIKTLNTLCFSVKTNLHPDEVLGMQYILRPECAKNLKIMSAAEDIFTFIRLIKLSWYKNRHIIPKNKLRKMCPFHSFSDAHFLDFGLNIEIYFVNFHIQSECGKTQTRKFLNMDTFHEVTRTHILPIQHFFLEYKILRQSKSYLTSDAINPKASQFQKKKRKKDYWCT